jgi:hypothetical protein
LGRWVSRDPIGEFDGPGIYLFLRNDAMTQWDILGMSASECCENKPFNPVNECCCKKTGIIYEKSQPFAWDGMIAITEFGYYAAFSVMHCNLRSNVGDDCKMHEVNVTALLGGVGTAITMGAVVSAIRFETFPMYPEGFKGYTSLVSSGLALVGGASNSIVKIGEGVSISILEVQLGVEYMGAVAVIGSTINFTSQEIPCEKW